MGPLGNARSIIHAPSPRGELLMDEANVLEVIIKKGFALLVHA